MKLCRIGKLNEERPAIIDKNNNETISKLTKGVAYYRDKGVEHNVFNNNNFPYSFIEVEMVD